MFISWLIVIPAFWQASIFKEGKIINHTLWAAVLCAIYSTFLGLMVQVENIDLPLFLASFGFFLSARFMFFDPLLNALRNKPPGYLGINTMDLMVKYISHWINPSLLRLTVFMVGSFFFISETARFYNHEHLTALVIFILIAISGAFFTYRYFYKPGKL